MNEKLAMEMFENGEAVGVTTNVILMRANGRVYFSFDGHDWHESLHQALNDILNGT